MALRAIPESTVVGVSRILHVIGYLPVIVTATYYIVIHDFKRHFSLIAYTATARTNAKTSAPELAIPCSAYPT
ncbi:hypothetical protein SBDP2_1690003 [Syntrophobacter sp. SbD2]|nr:hypothetical protein SBDP2_1690003 [Syntrophobacter sp. SbD2]